MNWFRHKKKNKKKINTSTKTYSLGEKLFPKLLFR